MRGTDDLRSTARRLAGRLDRVWHWLVVAGLSAFMFATRMRPFDDYNQPGAVYFFGTDPYYHTREILYSVANYPRILDYDPWTQYPLGTDPGQFGTLFDQIGASLAWLLGLVLDGGYPNQETLLDAATAYPAVLGALTIIPIFLLARDLFDRKSAIFVAVATALIPGTFLIRSLAAVVDHHIMEALLSTTAVWASYRALRTWQDTDVTFEQITAAPQRLYTHHRPALAWSLFAALAFWAYLAAWPPGVLFVGIVGLWLAVEVVLDAAREEDPGPVVAAGTTQFAFLAAMMLPYAIGSPKGGFSALNFTWLQPTAPLLVALALLALALVAREWKRREMPARAYPAVAIALGLVSVGVIALVLPALLRNVLGGASWVFDSTLGWLPGIGVQRTRFTISEAQPASFSQFGGQFGLLYVTAIAGLVLAAIDVWRDPERGDMLLVIWAFVGFSGALTQARFLYYLAVVVLILNGKLASKLYAGAKTLSEAEEDSGKGRSDADRIHPLTGKATVTVILVLILLPTNVLGFAADCGGDTNAWSLAGCFGPDEEVRSWSKETRWLRNHTPQGPLSLTTAYDAPEPGERFDYPEGAYGVLSWWDYGHQIEFEGRRAPIANPFQQQAPLASRIFTAQGEAPALEILNEYLGEGNQARYLMIDDAMVAGKFGAITVWADVQAVYQQGGRDAFDLPDNFDQDSVQLPTIGDRVRGMFLIEIFYNDASGYEHLRLVREHPRYVSIGNQGRITDDGRFMVQRYNSVLGSAPVQQIRAQFGSLSGGSGDQLVPIGQRAFLYDVHVESALKTYERVAGATLTGTGDPGDTVEVRIPLNVKPVDRRFSYHQSTTVGSNGTFELTVPYSTTGQVPVSEGGTDEAVHARGPAKLTVGGQEISVDVPERAVLAGDTVPVPSG